MHQAALFGGRMWGAFKDHATPFQGRVTTGNQTLPDVPGLLDSTYIYAFMYISNMHLTQPASCTCKVQTLRCLTCTRCYNQMCINKSEKWSKQSYRELQARAQRAERTHGGWCAKESFLLRDRREERSDVAEGRAVMFHSGGLERQMS